MDTRIKYRASDDSGSDACDLLDVRMSNHF